DPSFFDGHRQTSGGFSTEFFARLGLDSGARVPLAIAPAVARGLQRTIEETVLTLAGEGENLCLAGGLFYNALLVEFLERCACSASARSSPGCTGAWSSGRARWGIAAFWPLRAIPIRRRT